MLGCPLFFKELSQMPSIENPKESIGINYPNATGRFKRVVAASNAKKIVIALAGDSTLDNGFWVDRDIPYVEKKHTVTHQLALALARQASSTSFDIGNFAVDGAITADLMKDCPLDKVLPSDADHTSDWVYQLGAISEWKPDVVVLSVGGNNYREALINTLKGQLTPSQLLFRSTPVQARQSIHAAFQKVKAKLAKEYKQIIDALIASNPSLKRLVLVSQYYPAITPFTKYFIYTGFSHLARAAGKGRESLSTDE